ncbi:MAG: hypothetical protein ACLR7U_13030 [Ruthenibacterium lactatiformans]
MNRTEYVEAFKSMGIDTFISPKALYSRTSCAMCALCGTPGRQRYYAAWWRTRQALEFRAAETTRLGETLLDIRLSPGY